MDALREARLAWDIVSAFSCKTRQMGMSTEFKYGDYSGQTGGGQQSAQCLKSAFWTSALNRSPAVNK
jgi:hypothetical protein